jgi:cytochrome b
MSMLRRVWTWPVRAAHWSLVLLFVYAMLNDSGDRWHRYAGYAAAAIVGMRVLYGLRRHAGPARIQLPAVAAALAHVREMRSGHVMRANGHNALGAAMSLLLWLLVLLLALSGWVSRWDRYWGEEWPIVIHAVLAYGMLACVIMHLAGVILSSILEKQNLVKAMLSGRKFVDGESGEI